VEVEIEWAGVPVRLVDTAGLRGEATAVEREGIARSRRELEEADRILWVVDGSEPGSPSPEELPEARRTWVVVNKSDLGTANLEWVNDYSPLAVYSVSAKTLHGLNLLVEGAEQELLERLDGTSEDRSLGVSQRHGERLGEALEALGRARDALGAGRPVEMAAADLTRCLAALGEITGDTAGADLLDRIFSEFCIGK
jgi:tRNA modification GTPase